MIVRRCPDHAVLFVVLLDQTKKVKAARSAEKRAMAEHAEVRTSVTESCKTTTTMCSEKFMATLLVKTTTASDVAPISDVARAFGGKAFAELDHVKSDLPLMPEAGRSFIEQVVLSALVRAEKTCC